MFRPIEEIREIISAFIVLFMFLYPIMCLFGRFMKTPKDPME